MKGMGLERRPITEEAKREKKKEAEYLGAHKLSLQVYLCFLSDTVAPGVTASLRETEPFQGLLSR